MGAKPQWVCRKSSILCIAQNCQMEGLRAKENLTRSFFHTTEETALMSVTAGLLCLCSLQLSKGYFLLRSTHQEHILVPSFSPLLHKHKCKETQSFLADPQLHQYLLLQRKAKKKKKIQGEYYGIITSSKKFPWNPIHMCLAPAHKHKVLHLY